LFWVLKNYIKTGMVYIHRLNPPIYLHSLGEYTNYFARFYHYFWEIPLPEKVNISGTLSGSLTYLFYNLYYIATFITTAILSLGIILSLFKYGKKYKQYVFLMLPIAGFVFYWAFIIFWGPHDVGRYTFPLWLFLFLFPVKLIRETNKPKLRGLFYIIIAAFCILSTISAFGITLHMHNIDSQILQISGELQKINATGNFTANDEFTSSALSYYLKQPVKFNLTRNVRDTNIPCYGEHIFFSKNFDIFKEQREYRICRR